MTTVSIIGTGNMGSAIADLFEHAATVQSLSHGQASDALEGDIVVLAVPRHAVDELSETPERFAGKTVVDISNAVDQSTMRPVEFAEGSGAQSLQARIPDAVVLKAFNTNFAATLKLRSVGNDPVTVLVAGDSADAKREFVQLVEASGLPALDAGALDRARELESLGVFQIALAAGGAIGWGGGFAVVR